MRMILLRAFVALLSFTSIPNAKAYEESFRRYFSGHGIFRHLDQAFPQAASNSQQNYYSTNAKCYKIMGNGEVLGISKPLTGETTSKRPGAIFISWYTDCLRIRIGNSLPVNGGDATYAYYFPIGVVTDRFRWGASAWSDNPEPVRKALIKYWIQTLIGPSLVKDEAAVIARYDQKMVEARKNLRESSLTILYSSRRAIE